jgi:hypothetical protein
VVLTPEKSPVDVIAEASAASDNTSGDNYSKNRNDEEAPIPRDGSIKQNAGQMIVYNNGDKVILTEERFKTMFTLSMNELSKEKVNDICS